MAWVTQAFSIKGTLVRLEEDGVMIEVVDCTGEERVYLAPRTREEAHGLALMLRRAARRLEEIGKGLE